MGEKFAKVPNREDQNVEWFNSILAVHNIEVSSVTFLGDAKWEGRGALSTLERVQLILKNNQILNVILKILPANEQIRKYVVNTGFITREVNMYKKVFADLDKFQEGLHVPNDLRFRRPFCYYGAEEGTGDSYRMILVLEDMLDSGYSTWAGGQSEHLDQTRIKATIREIALFHAGFIAYGIVNKIQNFRDKYPFLLNMTQDDPNLQGYIDSGFGFVKEILKEDEKSIPVGFMDKLQDLSVALPRIIKEKFGTNFGFACIRHHDLHTGNFFYKTELDGMKAGLIDFQACTNDTPINDVAFFLFCCCDPTDAWENVDWILDYYHSVFKTCMDAMEVSFEFPIQRLQKDYNESILITLMHITTGSANWCGGSEGNDVSKNRLKESLFRAYNQNILNF